MDRGRPRINLELSEWERRRALEGGGQRWSFGCVAERENREQWQQAEWHQQSHEERRKQREPGRLVGAVGRVRNEKREESDNDRCDRNPAPYTLLVEDIH